MAATEFGGGIAERLDHLPDGGHFTLTDADGPDRSRPGAAHDALQIGQRKRAEGVTAGCGQEVPAIHVIPSKDKD